MNTNLTPEQVKLLQYYKNKRYSTERLKRNLEKLNLIIKIFKKFITKLENVR